MPDRKSTSLSLDRALVDRARELGINLSRAAETGIREAMRTAEAAQWKAENREAIATYNRMVEAEGLPLERYRAW